MEVAWQSWNPTTKQLVPRMKLLSNGFAQISDDFARITENFEQISKTVYDHEENSRILLFQTIAVVATVVGIIGLLIKVLGPS